MFFKKSSRISFVIINLLLTSPTLYTMHPDNKENPASNKIALLKEMQTQMEAMVQTLEQDTQNDWFGYVQYPLMFLDLRNKFYQLEKISKDDIAAEKQAKENEEDDIIENIIDTLHPFALEFVLPLLQIFEE